MPLLRRMWAPRRALTLAEAFRKADHFRREGRLPQALKMVAYGLRLDPDNVTGHLLAAYLHVAGRAMGPAKAEFQWVLVRDPHHARALLGRARIALEERELVSCRELLGRALRFYPEFPEAQALLDAVAAPRAPALPAAVAVVDRLRLPDHGRSLVVARHDGALVATGPGLVDEGPRAAALARILGVAAAALARCGLGAVRRAIMEDTEDAVFTRTDGTMLVALALPRTTATTQGLLEVNRLWAGVRQVDAPASSSAPVTAATTREGASDREGLMTPSRLVQSPAPRLKLSLESESGARGRHVCDVVEQLVGLHLVRGAMIVAPDGFVIAAQLPPALAVEPLAALAATLGRELEINAARLGRPPFQTTLFSADDGALLLGTTRIGFVVVLAEPHANLHSIRGALRDALARIEAVWQEQPTPPDA